MSKRVYLTDEQKKWFLFQLREYHKAVRHYRKIYSQTMMLHEEEQKAFDDICSPYVAHINAGNQILYFISDTHKVFARSIRSYCRRIFGIGLSDLYSLVFPEFDWKKESKSDYLIRISKMSVKFHDIERLLLCRLTGGGMDE